VKLSPAETARALSFREFSDLCALLDEKGETSDEVSIGGGRFVRMAGRLREAKFNVIRVSREPRNIQVLVDHGRGLVRWHKIESESANN
jgi:hypothetical protein